MRTNPSEGAQVLGAEIARHCREEHGGVVWGPLGVPSDDWSPIVHSRVLGLRTLGRLLRHRGDPVVYMPRSGLTRFAVLRALLITMVAQPRSLDIVVFQLHTQLSPWLRRLTRRWRFLVSTPDHEAVIARAGLRAGLAVPRVAGDRISGAPSRAAARAALGWGDGPHFLHVGHPVHRRNLRALEPLTDAGSVHVVLSDFKKEEPGAVPPENDRLHAYRGYRPDVADLYRAADVYVFPTFDTRAVIALPMSVFEALANQTPVVARRSDSLARWVDLPGLHLVDDDDELVRTAIRLATRGDEDAQWSAGATNRCLGDLSVCRPAAGPADVAATVLRADGAGAQRSGAEVLAVKDPG